MIVELKGEELRIAGFKFHLCGIERALLDIGDDNLHAGCRKRARHGQPDAAGASGNECHLRGLKPMRPWKPDRVIRDGTMGMARIELPLRAQCQAQHNGEERP